MSSIQARQEELNRIFLELTDEFDRFDYCIQKALSESIEFSEELRVPENQIEGCKSKLWVKVSLKNNVLEISCDSDSLI